MGLGTIQKYYNYGATGYAFLYFYLRVFWLVVNASSHFLQTVTQTATCCSNLSTAWLSLPLLHRRFWQSACTTLIFCLSSVKPQQPNIPSIKLHVVTLRKHLLSLITKCFPLLQATASREYRCFWSSYVKSHCSREQLHFMHRWCSV